jgi:hypothetical protein
MTWLRTTLTLVTLVPALLVGCSSGENEKEDTCTPAGGYCLTYNAPGAKGQGPRDCAQYGTWLFGKPLEESPLSCGGISGGGGVSCCMP